ncbi:MAG TPA: branched-chain amino acid ABC transporter permease [Clostridiales bacterium]|nr:branched-chain amino acid ABC transporter permease [Clostridiales bacterium]
MSGKRVNILKSIPPASKNAFINYGIVIAAFAVITALRSLGLLSISLEGQLVPICCYIVMAISLNLTVGILGELSLGHAGFMSVGAFTGIIVSGLLSAAVPNGALRLLTAIIVGGIAAGIVGVLVGIPVLRLNGDYLAIVTLAFGEIIKNIINCLYIGYDSAGIRISMTSEAALGLGPDGKIIIDGAIGAVNIQKISTFTAGFLLVLVCLVVIQNLVNSRNGRAIMALRDNQIAAESVGINIVKYKMMAFVTSAVMAGMAGCLFALNYSTVVAKKFDFNTSILVLVFVVLGGIGNIRGSMIAATVLYILPEMLRGIRDYRMLVYAVVLILVMIVTNNPTIRSLLYENVLNPMKALIPKKKGGAADADEN